MSATCEPPTERVLRKIGWSHSTYRKAMSAAERLHRGTGRLVHIWRRSEVWWVGWRYVGPALPPGQDAADQGRG